MRRIIVAIDPATTSGWDADETGIICAGLGVDGHGYVLEDVSGRFSPIEWARKAIALYTARKADRIVAEVNNGGEMVEHTLRMVDGYVSFKPVHASRGKAIRAEPVSALYEQNKVHHVGIFTKLEDQQCAFIPDFDRTRAGYSPDRMDALVWALTELMVDGSRYELVVQLGFLRAQQQLGRTVHRSCTTDFTPAGYQQIDAAQYRSFV